MLRSIGRNIPDPGISPEKNLLQTHPWTEVSTWQMVLQSRQRRRQCSWSGCSGVRRWTGLCTGPTWKPGHSVSSLPRCVWSGRPLSPQSWKKITRGSGGEYRWQSKNIKKNIQANLEDTKQQRNPITAFLHKLADLNSSQEIFRSISCNYNLRTWGEYKFHRNMAWRGVPSQNT